MSRPSRVYIDQDALRHNLEIIKKATGNKPIIAMVKANAYGCGVKNIIPLIKDDIYAFGVASIEEALAIRNLNISTPCIIFQGLFSFAELHIIKNQNIQIVIHQPYQLDWLAQIDFNLKIWIKVNTGMNRLGFKPEEVSEIIKRLQSLNYIDKEIGLISHFSCADQINHPNNNLQIETFLSLSLPKGKYIKSLANSAAILSLPKAHLDIVRPGIMLYGISPFADLESTNLNLKPVMRFYSKIIAIHYLNKNSFVGYANSWKTKRRSRIGVVPVGYGDGYPRVLEDPCVWVNGHIIPIIGKISMDMLSIDLTDFPNINLNDDVELWGENLKIEIIAHKANTIAYELICKVTQRVNH